MLRNEPRDLVARLHDIEQRLLTLDLENKRQWYDLHRAEPPVPPLWLGGPWKPAPDECPCPQCVNVSVYSPYAAGSVWNLHRSSCGEFIGSDDCGNTVSFQRYSSGGAARLTWSVVNSGTCSPAGYQAVYVGDEGSYDVFCDGAGSLVLAFSNAGDLNLEDYPLPSTITVTPAECSTGSGSGSGSSGSGSGSSGSGSSGSGSGSSGSGSSGSGSSGSGSGSSGSGSGSSGSGSGSSGSGSGSSGSGSGSSGSGSGSSGSGSGSSGSGSGSSGSGSGSSGSGSGPTGSGSGSGSSGSGSSGSGSGSGGSGSGGSGSGGSGSGGSGSGSSGSGTGGEADCWCMTSPSSPLVWYLLSLDGFAPGPGAAAVMPGGTASSTGSGSGSGGEHPAIDCQCNFAPPTYPSAFAEDARLEDCLLNTTFLPSFAEVVCYYQTDFPGMEIGTPCWMSWGPPHPDTGVQSVIYYTHAVARMPVYRYWDSALGAYAISTVYEISLRESNIFGTPVEKVVAQYHYSGCPVQDMTLDLIFNQHVTPGGWTPEGENVCEWPETITLRGYF